MQTKQAWGWKCRCKVLLEGTEKATKQKYPNAKGEQSNNEPDSGNAFLFCTHNNFCTTCMSLVCACVYENNGGVLWCVFLFFELEITVYTWLILL